MEEAVRKLANKAEAHSGNLLTEEAVKNALVMPFLIALGYDVFDTEQIIPEFIADHGVKKGEKVDYAVKIDGRIIMLFECKGYGVDLSQQHLSQLFRYFSVTDARFGVLTNGVEYWFFSDLDHQNKMDNKPFFKFDILSYQSNHISELKRFSRNSFDLDKILASASQLKYTTAIIGEIRKEFDAPSEEFVKLLFSRVADGRFTAANRSFFTPIVKNACRDIVRDLVQERLSNALQSTSAETTAADGEDDKEDDGDEIVTTDEEVEAFLIIKAIVRSAIPADRIHMRDQKTYCSVLIDNNNRRRLARLRFNTKQKYVGLFDNGEEDRQKIETLDDIFAFEDRLRNTAARYAEMAS